MSISIGEYAITVRPYIILVGISTLNNALCVGELVLHLYVFKSSGLSVFLSALLHSLVCSLSFRFAPRSFGHFYKDINNTTNYSLFSIKNTKVLNFLSRTCFCNSAGLVYNELKQKVDIKIAI
jgi:hypothetical protein